MDDQTFYDRYYYLTSCGIRYDDKNKWESFFGDIADKIVQEINPKTVLDAGCAYGYLVAALRDRGVEAYGIDISEYAISQVRADIQPFCRVGSVTDPLSLNYDLIICIEVIEHLQAKEGREAIENLCRYTDDFIFTSTPNDFKEATHFNVQPTDYWVRLFANRGFFRDVAFDASFIISHAIRFKKLKDAFPSIIGDYERAYYKYFLENKNLRDELIFSRSVISQRFNENESTLLAEKNQIIHDKDIHIDNLDKFLSDKEAGIFQLNTLIHEKDEQISQLNALLTEKENYINNLKTHITALDKAHLKHVEEQMDRLHKAISEKDELIQAAGEKHIQQLNAHIYQLQNNASGKEQELEKIAFQLTQVTGLIESLKKSIADENLHEHNFHELVALNNTLKEKLTYLYKTREDKEKKIYDLHVEIQNLRVELNNTSKYNESILIPYKSAALELERIKKLKGHKLLWKYYDLRDQVLMRARRRKLPPANTPSPVDHKETGVPQIIPFKAEKILEKEREYYSKNPIYSIDLPYTPLISIIVPIFNTPDEVLEEMIKSVIYQTYPHFELLILDASNENMDLSVQVKKYAGPDSRINYRKIQNKGIAENTNAGITAAKGDFIAFLDHDDIIAPHALFEVASRLQDDKNAYDFFYSDKDMMPEHGEVTHNPLYKPEWSPEIMFSANYLTHFCVIRKKIIEEAGLLDTRTDGAQDWDIFLKVSRISNKICHIPYKLYHWRIIQTSVASGIGAKPYALQAQLTSLENHFKAMNYNATAVFQDQEKSIIQVQWHDTGIKMVSFIINHSGTIKQLQVLLDQIKEFTYSDHLKSEALILCQPGITPKLNDSYENIHIIQCKSVNIYDDINRIVKENMGDVLLFIESSVSFLNATAIHELVTWAAQKQYGVITPQIINAQNKIVSAGIVINDNYILNMFQDVHAGHYTIFGHTNWYRNITACHLECFAVKTRLLRETGYFKADHYQYACIEFCLRLLKLDYRHVYNPFSVARIGNVMDLNENRIPEILEKIKQDYDLKSCDPYWNPNLLSNHGVPQENKRKVNILPSKKHTTPAITGWEKYSSDAFYLAHEFDFSESDLSKNFETLLANKEELAIETVNWILPHFDFIYYAGIYTIFRFANYLQSVKGVKNTFVTVGGSDEKEMYSIIIEAFPLLKNSRVVCLKNISEVSKIPYADSSICSLWTTAYYLLRFNNTKRKFYFIQDFEPLFYPAGSTFGQTETTYKFGFYGITNTKGLRSIYEAQYGGKSIDLKPCIDSTIFYPAKIALRSKVFRIFFYGRPGHPRNGFELGSTALKLLKSKLKDKVEIYCAGSDWDPADYGLADVVINMGRMDFEKTGDLYRICDVGLVMMFTKHPSYLPFEFMACGCAVVSNYNNDTTWFFKDGFNCLLTEPTASRISEIIQRLLSDVDLKKTLVRNALNDIQQNHAEWNTELNAIYQFMCNPNKESKED